MKRPIARVGPTRLFAAGCRSFDFRNAERAAAQVEQRALPRIIGRPANAEQLIIRAGQRAQEVERAAAAKLEQFAAEQAAAETAEITPLLAETGAATAETGGFAAVATGAAEALIPAAVGLAVRAGGALLAGRTEAGTQTDPPRGSGVAAAVGGALEGRAGASAFPTRATLAEPVERLLAAWAWQRWDWAWARWAEPTRALGTCSEATAATRPRAQAGSSKTCER